MMALAIHEIYDVICNTRSEVNGQYIREKINFFRQKEGIHILTTAKAKNNQWGIGDGKFFICLAKIPTVDPSEAKDWTSLRSNYTNYVPCRVQILPFIEDLPLESPTPVPPPLLLENEAKIELDSELARVRFQSTTSAASELQTQNELIQRQAKDLENAHTRQQTFQALLRKSQNTEQELRAKVASLEAANSQAQTRQKTLLASLNKTQTTEQELRAKISSLEAANSNLIGLADPCYVEEENDWEYFEEFLGYYKNKVTGMMQPDAPTILSGSSTKKAQLAPAMQENSKDSNLDSHLAYLQLQATNAVLQREILTEVILRQEEELLKNCRAYDPTTQIALLTASNTLLREQLNNVKKTDIFSIKEIPPPPPLTSALVKRHVLRDAPAEADAVFPSGAQIRTEFLAINSRIEAFAFDAMNSLEDLGHNHSTDFFTSQVMVPLYAVTQRHVAGLVEAQRAHLLALCGESADWGEGSGAAALSPHRQFFLSTQQTRLLEQVMQLDEARVAAFVAELGPTAVIVREAMQAPTFHGILEDGLRLDQLVRFMLRMHTVAMLSDPRCHLLPLPGQRLPYQPHLHTEILSPGVKRHGYIKEGEEVEVVFCGLCFRPADLEPPTDDPVAVSAPVNGLDKPPALVPALVRRVVADAR